MDRLFDDAFTRPLGQSGISTMPAIDLYQTADEVVVKASLAASSRRRADHHHLSDAFPFFAECFAQPALYLYLPSTRWW